ncbi:MAG TPA: diphthine--ammonia ligase [Candidatus Margulisiibacteriota bacterium]|nr:diphthine--ammonia ligase [Candidatus Margulisiibacteriota bacterium]
MPQERSACSWSSGKDSCLALYKAMEEGCKVDYLFNFISFEYGRVSFHGTDKKLVELQSEALGIPLMQRVTTKDNYEEIFTKTLLELKEKGITHIIRGDIHLIDLSDWVENICAKAGMKVVSPLWNKPTESLLKELIDLGFKAVITSAQIAKIGEGWAGRLIDKKLMEELKLIKGIDICGEYGEYHSFVYDGPNFNKRINILKTDKVKINDFWFLDIQEYRLEDKAGKK